MRRRRHHYGLTRTEKMTYWAERFWTCRIRRRHHVKMDSHPYCYRCGRMVKGRWEQ